MGKKLLAFLVGNLLFGFGLFGQVTFTTTGNASSTGGGCYELTPNTPWMIGTAWCNTPINLSQPLSIQYNLYFGAQDAGADGIAFVLQNQGTAVTGTTGQGMGYQGLTPSVIIEFDTFQNGFDPLNDHAGVTLNGEPDHTMAVNTGTPVYPFPINIEDGNWHSIEIKWDPATFTLQLIFDCQTVLSYTNDITTNIFSANPNVWWGFTSATGGAWNQQQFCYAPPFVLTANSASVTCNGQCNGSAAITNVSGGLPPYSYLWNNGQTTTAVSGLCAGTYTISVTSSLGCVSADTIVVPQPAAVTATISASTNVSCAGGNNGSATVAGNGGTGIFTYVWNTSPPQAGATANNLSAGNYSVIVSDANGCTATTSVSILPGIVVTAAAGPASTICSGQSVVLSASGGSLYAWSNGASTSSITVSPVGSTTYSVTVSNGPCSSTTAVTVSVIASPTVSISGNNTLCTGDITTLTASGGGTYTWSNASTGAAINVSPAVTSTYSVVAANSGCTDTAVVVVTVSPPPVAGVNNATICAGQTATLTGSGGASYVWSNGSSTNPMVVSPAANTTYTVIVSIGTCKDTAVGNVVVKPVPLASAGSSVTIEAGNDTTLFASGGGTFLWSNGSTSSVISVSPMVTTVYCVTVTQNGCSDSACVTVYVEPIDCSTVGKLYLPNAFSPNGDEDNDRLGIYFGNMLCIRSFELHIFNRWGQQVFETDNPAVQWDGIFKGEPEAAAIFVYRMRAELLTGEKIVREGNISLVR